MATRTVALHDLQARVAVMLAVMFADVASAADETWYDCLIDPARTVEVATPASGILQDVLVRRGDRVMQGMPLARLDSAVEGATVDLLRTRVGMTEVVDAQRQQTALLDRRRERILTLQARGIASEDAVDQIEAERLGALSSLRQAELELAVAEKELARAEIALARRTIASPFDGVVQRLTRNEGEYVDGDDPILQLVQLDPLRIEVYLPLAVYDQVSVGAKVDLRTTVPDDAAFEARVEVIDPIFDAASGTFGVELSVSNPGQEIPAGQRCQLHLRD
jgi:RND family efflux transporter MFP subunit